MLSGNIELWKDPQNDLERYYIVLERHQIFSSNLNLLKSAYLEINGKIAKVIQKALSVIASFWIDE